MDAISHSSVRRLIYLGDAYSCLPQDDNYGVSEQKHQSVTHFSNCPWPFLIPYLDHLKLNSTRKSH